MSTSIRQSMPRVAEFIDACRLVFGKDKINASIRAGMNGHPAFYASEGGVEIGTRDTTKYFSVDPENWFSTARLAEYEQQHKSEVAKRKSRFQC